MDKEPVTIVDIRASDVYQQAHIPGAFLLGDENIDAFLQAADKTKPLICYCYHGFSSQGACEFLKQSGFGRVFSIEGGFEFWRNVYPTECNK